MGTSHVGRYANRIILLDKLIWLLSNCQRLTVYSTLRASTVIGPVADL